MGGGRKESEVGRGACCDVGLLLRRRPEPYCLCVDVLHGSCWQMKHHRLLSWDRAWISLQPRCTHASASSGGCML